MTFVRIRLWPLRRDNSSRVLISAAGTWRSDRRRRDVGVLIGQSGCGFFGVSAPDSTRACDPQRKAAVSLIPIFATDKVTRLPPASIDHNKPSIC